MRVSPSARQGSDSARSSAPAIDRHGAASSTASGAKGKLERVRIDHVNPGRQQRAERMVRVEDGVRLDWVVVAGQQDDGPDSSLPDS